MKPKNSLHLAGLLLILVCAALLSPALSTEAQEVHALFILKGLDDSGFGPALEMNESHMKELMLRVSQFSTVHLTVLEMDDDGEDVVTRMSLANLETSDIQVTEQETASGSVERWLTDVKSTAHDTVLIYFAGFWPAHFTRADLSLSLKKKPARLKMLITDADNMDADTSTVPVLRSYIRIVTEYEQELRRKRLRFAVERLFLKHKGMLDINATSPGEYAFMDSEGGFFTSALISSIESIGLNQERFDSWAEVFALTQIVVQERFRMALASGQMPPHIEQATQTPHAYSLPAPVR